MLQILASGVSPMPLLDIHAVPLNDTDDAAEGDGEAQPVTTGVPAGFYVIAVPRSPSAPHAVLVNDGFRYPKRNGATTRYLSEPEVAAAYRDRHAGLAAQTRRIDELEREARQRLDRDQSPWVMISAVPDLPGDIEITSTVQRRFQEQPVGQHAYDVLSNEFGVTFHRVLVGRVPVARAWSH